MQSPPAFPGSRVTEDIGIFATQQTSQLLALEAKAVDQPSALERLTRQTEEALVNLEQELVGIHGKLISAVEECKTATVGEVDVLRS